MKKQLFNILLCGLLVVPFMGAKADQIEAGQSTEGRDFWVTFLQADQLQSLKSGKPNGDWSGDNRYNTLVLSLSISSRVNCQVTITNPYTNYSETVDVTANQMKLVDLYKGHPVCADARAAMATTGKVCYATNSEQVDTCALHVTATANVSLFATNYKKATFDATNVIPTPSLLDEYVIQTYKPSNHSGASQGSHFAIIAAEDNTVIEYVPTVATKAIRDFLTEYNNWGDDVFDMYPQYERFRNFRQIGDTIVSEPLKAGQVWYAWTGEVDSDDGDLSGTWIKARDGKKIAVFQGCPHTNIPYKVKQRDHIFSQAMPTKYWGKEFALTASSHRPIDIIRVLALNDNTDIYINGKKEHTINFATDKKHYWEFEIGKEGAFAKDSSCFLTTSCPCAVHLFVVSQEYHGNSDSDGDPAMLWINPIEQQIDTITFATYASRNDKCYHYVNVVTSQPTGMKLNNKPIGTSFKNVSGSSDLYYAQLSLGYTEKDTQGEGGGGTNTLTCENGKFIAHVYGFSQNESYGYSAGGATKSLSQSIYINGEEFSPDKENKLCGKDTVKFACKPDFLPDSITWHFGDGTPDVTLKQDTTTIVPHYYQNGGLYDASCTIYRNSSNVCEGQSAKTVIKIQVNIGRYSFSIGEPKIPCPEKDGTQKPGTIPYTSTIDLTGKNVTVDFNDVAKAAGFGKNMLSIKPDHFDLEIPVDAESGVKYGITIDITSNCGDTTAVLLFSLPLANDVIDQRYTNVLGLLKNHPKLKGQVLSDFQWFRTSDSTALPNQTSSVLNMYDIPGEDYMNDEFYVEFWVNKGQPDSVPIRACAKPFIVDTTKHSFYTEPDSLIISASYGYKHGDKVFVNANWGGKTDIECYAQWITTSGNIYKDWKFLLPNGGCLIDTPTEPDLYLLRVVTDKKTRSFKFIIQ